MTNFFRRIARCYFPEPLRKLLGRWYGKLRSRAVLPFLGLLFDLGGARFRANGCIYEIPKKVTSLEFRSCFLTGKYEKDERYLIPKYVISKDTVLELGACLGVVSCITNKILERENRHVVVEANPNCLPAIYNNRRINDCTFIVENCAIALTLQVEFYLHPRYITSSSLKPGEGVPVKIPGRSLRDFVDRYGSFTVLIMDIEGGELEVFESSKELLSQFRLIILELHDWVISVKGVERCREILLQEGFQLVEESYVTQVWRKI